MRIWMGQENIMLGINPAKLQVFPYPLHLFQDIPFCSAQSRTNEIVVYHPVVQFLLVGIVSLALRIDTNRLDVVHVDALR